MCTHIYQRIHIIQYATNMFEKNTKELRELTFPELLPEGERDCVGGEGSEGCSGRRCLAHLLCHVSCRCIVSCDVLQIYCIMRKISLSHVTSTPP